jgi:uncharacterized protein YfbU (UPF0304 family)
MKLSDGEKLILMMLADMYRALDIEDSEIDPDFVTNTIMDDHLWGFRWKYHHIPFERKDNPLVVSDVVNFLDMWKLLEAGYNELSETEKSRVKSETGGREVKFIGFDGNNEPEYLSIARYLIEQLGKWQSFRERQLDSHTRTIERYGRMFRAFEPIRKDLIGRELQADEIIQVMMADRR